VTTRIYSSDEIQYFAYLRSIWFDHDLQFENEYQYFYDHKIATSEGFHETFLERTTETGRRRNYGTIGCAILWTPFYAVGHLAALATGAPADGFSKPYVAAVAYGSAFYGLLAIVLSILCAARLGYDGFWPAVAVWLGTPLLFYMYIAPPFSHACSAFGVALFIYIWLRVRDDWSTPGLVALAASGALMAMIREQDAFFVAGPVIDYAVSVVNAKWRMPNAKGILAAAVTFGVVFTPQAISYWLLNGHIGPHSSVANKMNWAAPHAWQVLFSPQHGLFVWTPLALVALAGLVIRPKGGTHTQDPVASAFRRKSLFAGLVLMVALQIYVAGSVESWTVAGAFGQRRFIALTPILVIGLARVMAGLKPRPTDWLKPRPTDSRGATASRGATTRRALFAVSIAVLVYWNVALIAEFSINLMDRQKLEPRKNAYDAVVTLPLMAPDLAYRYLFDRSSFYKPK